MKFSSIEPVISKYVKRGYRRVDQVNLSDLINKVVKPAGAITPMNGSGEIFEGKKVLGLCGVTTSLRRSSKKPSFLLC